MKLKTLFLALLLGSVSYAHCSDMRVWRGRHRISYDSLVVRSYLDSLRMYKAKADTMPLNVEGHPSAYLDARFSKLFTPLAFYHTAATNTMGLHDDSDDFEKSVDRALLNVYINRPDLVEWSELELEKAGNLHEEITAPIRHRVEYADRTDVPVDDEIDIPLNIKVEKPNFWTFGGDYYLQFLQNYVSGNWYKGGESNYSMVSSATLQANYNNKQKVKFENKLELKLGFQTSRGDTLHSFKTSEDLIRYTGKLGLQATKNWYYTLQMIASTQFLRGYKSNDPLVYSDFLSPLNINLSLGMSYSVDAFKGRLKGSLQMAPIAYNFRYVGREALATRYGLDEGSRTMHDIGSECTIDLTWVLSELIKWKTRLYGYTTYERAEIEWENTISFQFNKYISSNIFIYPRFDDAAQRDGHHGYWQFKEYASIGFAYSF